MFLGLLEYTLEIINCFTYENAVTFAKIAQVFGGQFNQISVVAQYVEWTLEVDISRFTEYFQRQ